MDIIIPGNLATAQKTWNLGVTIASVLRMVETTENEASEHS